MHFNASAGAVLIGYPVLLLAAVVVAVWLVIDVGRDTWGR